MAGSATYCTISMYIKWQDVHTHFPHAGSIMQTLLSPHQSSQTSSLSADMRHTITLSIHISYRFAFLHTVPCMTASVHVSVSVSLNGFIHKKRECPADMKLFHSPGPHRTASQVWPCDRISADQWILCLKFGNFTWCFDRSFQQRVILYFWFYWVCIS